MLSLAQWAALKDQQKRGGVNLNGAYFPRVRAEPSDALRQQTDPLEPAGRRFANFFFESSFSTVLFRDFPSDVGQQSDPQSDRPLAPPAGRRRHFLNSGWGWCGRRGAGFAGVVGGAGRAQRGTGSTLIPPRSKQH